MRRTRTHAPLWVAVFVALILGCAAPRAQLSFPASSARATPDGTAWYDVDRDGRTDFAVGAGRDGGRLDVVSYDDDEDGRADRVYRLSDYRDADVPHLILLLDSIPFQEAADLYAAGGLRWFNPPAKVIAPFPSLTEVCYTDVLRAPPLPGVIDQHYDPLRNRVWSGLWKRINGHEQPWERRLSYGAKFHENGSSYLDPRGWYAAELERVRRAVHDSPHRVIVCYVTSASAMVCKFGEAGSDEVLAGAARLCLQLLHERRGAIKITMMSDHGHNLVPSKNVDLRSILREAGLRPSNHLRRPDDAVIEINGLVTYAAVHTQRPGRLVDVLARRPEVDQVMYLDGDRAIVRTVRGSAAIEARDGIVRYVPLTDGQCSPPVVDATPASRRGAAPITSLTPGDWPAVDRDAGVASTTRPDASGRAGDGADVLGYQPVLDALRAAGRLPGDGFVADADWLAFTVDHEYPDAPRRIWDALHRQAVHVPRVMFTLRDGHCAGIGAFERFITMASTHGSLNQSSTATFVMSMSDRVTGPLRSRDVLGAVEPGYDPPVRAK